MKDLVLKLMFSRVSPSSFALTKRQLSKSFTVVIHPLSTRLIKAELIYNSHMFLKIKGPYGSSCQCKRHLWYGTRYIIYIKCDGLDMTELIWVTQPLYKREINWSEAMFLTVRNAIKHYTAEKLLQVKR